jgi:hypothetical protein
MKYDKPELTALTPAISAIQLPNTKKENRTFEDYLDLDIVAAYADWE